jgi:hypothetical protein
VRSGPPVPVITEYAREMNIDLIVVGTHARGVVNRILMGSVSRAVLEKASCAVLIVPQTAAAPGPPAAVVTAGRLCGAAGPAGERRPCAS